MFLNTTLFVKSLAAALLLIVSHGCDNYPEDPLRTLRYRQEGHVYFGEAFIIPARLDNLIERIQDLKEKIQDLNWRIFEITITLVKEL
jgi:hypothetical protein